MTGTIITDSQKASFKEDGYLILRNILSEEAQLELIRMTQEVKDWPDTPGTYIFSVFLKSFLISCCFLIIGKWMPYLEIDSKGQKVVSRVENYVNYHAGFETLLRGPTVINILEQLSGEKMHLFKVGTKESILFAFWWKLRDGFDGTNVRFALIINFFIRFERNRKRSIINYLGLVDSMLILMPSLILQLYV